MAFYVDLFIGCVRQMRSAQKQYFKTKDYASLLEAKKQEAEVDRQLRELDADKEREQPGFDFGV